MRQWEGGNGQRGSQREVLVMFAYSGPSHGPVVAVGTWMQPSCGQMRLAEASPLLRVTETCGIQHWVWLWWNEDCL